MSIGSIGLKAGDLSLSVAPELGASITAFRLGNFDLLRPTAETASGLRGRGCSCFPLVPYSNRIAKGGFSWQGASYTLPCTSADRAHAIHGNALDVAWQIDHVDEQNLAVSYQHTASGEGPLGPGGWPWPYRISQGFSLGADELVLTLVLTNLADEAFPAGLGWHPYFPMHEGATLGFEAAAVWLNGADLLPAERVPASDLWPAGGGRPLDGVALNNCFAGWTGKADIGFPVAGIGLELVADAPLRHLVVYAVPGAAAFAVEPVSHMNDAIHHPITAIDGGLRILKPQESMTARLVIRVNRNPRSSSAS